MLVCKRCGKPLSFDKKKQNGLGVIRFSERIIFPKIKVVKVDKICDECLDEYNKFFIGEE